MKTKDVVLTRKCYECKGTMQGRYENYTYTEAGLKSVVLKNILVFHCSCGAIVPEILNPTGLHFLIAMSVLRKETLLSGEEIRFLRKVADYSATQLADVLGVGKTAVSKWENDAKKIGKESDRLIRLVSFARMIEKLMASVGSEIGSGAEDGLAQGLLRTARMVKSLNITSILDKIEDRSEGSVPVRINPEELCCLGDGSSVAEPELVLQ